MAENKCEVLKNDGITMVVSVNQETISSESEVDQIGTARPANTPGDIGAIERPSTTAININPPYTFPSPYPYNR